MIIKLRFDIPVEDKHGMVEGRELEVVSLREDRVFVQGDAGELVGILKHEYVVTDDAPV